MRFDRHAIEWKARFLLIFKGKTMMDRKPWQDKGLRRSFDGDEGGERRRFGRFDRFDREERSDRREFGDRPRRDFGDRKPFWRPSSF